MSVPQRIPLSLLDDRDDRLVLQEKNAARPVTSRPPREGAALVRFVHDAKAVQHHVRVRCDRR